MNTNDTQPMTKDQFVAAICEAAGTRDVADEADTWFVQYGEKLQGEDALDCRMRQEIEIEKYEIADAEKWVCDGCGRTFGGSDDYASVEDMDYYCTTCAEERGLELTWVS